MKGLSKFSTNKATKVSGLKKSIFIPFFVFGVVFISVSILTLYQVQKKNVEKDLAFEFDNIETMFKNKIQSDAISLRLYLGNISANTFLADALKHNDRNKLEKISKVYFKNGKSDLNPDLLNFISSDGITRYRSHRPDKFGDTITHSVLYKKAVLTGATSFHISAGAFSDQILKVILPIRDVDQRVMGYIIIGKSFNKVLDEIAKQTHMDYMFFAKKNIISENTDNYNQKKHGFFRSKNDSLVLDWTTFSKNVFFDKKLIENELEADTASIVEFNNDSYLFKTIRLNNFDYTEFGRAMVLHSNSMHMKDLRKNTASLVLIAVGLMFVLGLIFNIILNKVEKDINSKNQKLLEALKKRILMDKKLVQKNNELKQLTLIASHDLRSPLTSLEGLLHILKSGNVDPDVNSFVIDNASASVQLMKDTVDSMATIVKQRESLADEAVPEISIEAVFNDVLLQLGYLIDEKQIEIKSDFTSCQFFQIKEIHLKSILQNILSNAIKFAADNTEVKKQIEVTTQLKDEFCSIVIKDNGIGFDSDFQKENLFKPFKRYHHDNKGSGIGLYLTKLIVEHYGGKIDVKSEIGKGTTVKIEV